MTTMILMTPYNRKEIGQLAEEAACRFLQAKGFQLLEKNFTCYNGEIDLIMQDQDDVVFVEVRLRHRDDFGSALESITQSKMTKLIKAATLFLQKKKWLYKRNSRFDVALVHSLKENGQIDWIKNAFTVERY
jgi:putative endonuclease